MLLLSALCLWPAGFLFRGQLRFGLHDNDGLLTEIIVPLYDKKKRKAVAGSVPVWLPLDQFAAEFARDPSSLNRKTKDPATYDTPAFREHPMYSDTAVPFSMYSDAASFSKKDSVYIMTSWVPWEPVRRVIFTLAKSRFCRCGCKGLDTLLPIFKAISWSVNALQVGQWPLRDHAGNVYTDPEKGARAGTSLGFTAVLTGFRADWSECSVSSKLSPQKEVRNPPGFRLFLARTRALPLLSALPPPASAFCLCTGPVSARFQSLVMCKSWAAKEPCPVCRCSTGNMYDWIRAQCTPLLPRFQRPC